MFDSLYLQHPVPCIRIHSLELFHIDNVNGLGLYVLTLYKIAQVRGMKPNGRQLFGTYYVKWAKD